MNSIIKWQPEHSDFDAFVWAMFLLWASRPSKQSSEPDGSYFIGTIDKPRLNDQRLQRDTPYSTCAGIRRNYTETHQYDSTRIHSVSTDLKRSRRCWDKVRGNAVSD